MGTLITFGIAAYNVEQYIQQCIGSVARQNGSDIEIIIVDDGSTDATAVLCDEYAEKDTRIRVIHQPNGGVSSARNRIIHEASGQYISFVDGDDLLTSDCADTMRRYFHDGSDIINFDLSYFRFDEQLPVYSIKAPDMDITGHELQELAAFTIYNTAESKAKYINKTILSSCGKIFCTAFLRKHKLLFNEGLRKAQDSEFNFRCALHAERIKLVRKGIYLYRNNPNSVTKRYNPKIREYNNALLDTFRQDIDHSDRALQPLLRERFDCLVIDVIAGIFILDIFHPDNPASGTARRNSFERVISDTRYTKAIARCSTNVLRDNDRLFYHFIITKDFSGAERYFKKLYRRDKYKAVINKLGITKIYKKITERN